MPKAGFEKLFKRATIQRTPTINAQETEVIASMPAIMVGKFLLPSFIDFSAYRDEQVCILVQIEVSIKIDLGSILGFRLRC